MPASSTIGALFEIANVGHGHCFANVAVKLKLPEAVLLSNRLINPPPLATSAHLLPPGRATLPRRSFLVTPPLSDLSPRSTTTLPVPSTQRKRTLLAALLPRSLPPLDENAIWIDMTALTVTEREAAKVAVELANVLRPVRSAVTDADPDACMPVTVPDD